MNIIVLVNSFKPIRINFLNKIKFNRINKIFKATNFLKIVINILNNIKMIEMNVTILKLIHHIKIIFKILVN